VWHLNVTQQKKKESFIYNLLGKDNINVLAVTIKKVTTNFASQAASGVGHGVAREPLVATRRSNVNDQRPCASFISARLLPTGILH
jgi:hypothetical protein